MKVRLNHRNRRGFTLIELVVVLLVLAGLAGMLVPVLQNMVQKTHGATGGANMNEVAKAIQMYEAQSMGRHPNGYDSLIDELGEVVGEDHVAATALDADQAEALDSIGITTLYDLDSASTNKTFEPYGATPVARPIVDGAEVAVLNPDGIAALRLPPTTGVYVAFGVGALNTAIGKTMLEAPVHFPEGGESPVGEYSRFAAIYEIPAEGAARLATIAAFHHGHDLVSLGTHLEEFYETQQL